MEKIAKQNLKLIKVGKEIGDGTKKKKSAFIEIRGNTRQHHAVKEKNQKESANTRPLTRKLHSPHLRQGENSDWRPNAHLLQGGATRKGANKENKN